MTLDKKKYRQKYYLAHKDKEKSYQKKYYWENPEICRKRSMSWKKSNKNKVKNYRRNYRKKNKTRENTLRRVWRLNHKDKVKNTLLKRSYGITIDQFNKLIFDQKNSCGICNKSLNGKYPYKPTVDHIHNKIKKIRGILCQKCNSALGLFRDNPQTMLSAIKWIKEIKSITKKRKIKSEIIISKKYYNNIKRIYHLTPNQFDKLLIESKNSCGICEIKFTNKYPCRPCIDHNHTTGKIRGLLCSKCNNALGFFDENTNYILNAIKWVQGAKNENS
jgi:hypothetical protein